MNRYHWLMLVLSVAITMGVAAPTLLTDPPLYQSSAELTIDQARYGQVFRDGQTSEQFEHMQFQALELLRKEFHAFGTRYTSAKVEVPQAGQLRVIATARSAEEARRIADRASFRLTQHIRAAAGRDLLRQLMNYQLYLMAQGQPPADAFEQGIRELFVNHVFEIESETTARAPQLASEDMIDLTRALEVRHAEFDLLLDRPDLSPERKNAALIDREALRRVLIGLQDQYSGTEYTPSAAYISARAPLPAREVERHLLLKAALALLVGLVGGLLAVAVDRAVGVVVKLRELWAYRELMRNLVTRDLKARYKGSLLGYFWSLANPLLMIAIFYVVFRVLLQNTISYFHVFLMAALLPWNYSVGAIGEGMSSVTANGALVKKVYFPREILPIATVISNLISFVMALPMLMLVIVLTGAPLSWPLLFLPVIVVIQTIFLVGLVLSLSATAVFFRDTQHIIGILIQLWFFLTPVFYSLDDVAGDMARYMRWLNPMASIVDFYRDLIYGGVARDGAVPTPAIPALDGVARTGLTALLVLAVGVYIFHRGSGRFAEEL